VKISESQYQQSCPILGSQHINQPHKYDQSINETVAYNIPVTSARSVNVLTATEVSTMRRNKVIRLHANDSMDDDDTTLSTKHLNDIDKAGNTEQCHRLLSHTQMSEGLLRRGWSGQVVTCMAYASGEFIKW